MLRETLTGDSSLHVEQVVVDFREDVAVAMVESAWRETVAATEVLKGRFGIEEGEAVGFIPNEGAGEWLENGEEPRDW